MQIAQAHGLVSDLHGQRLTIAEATAALAGMDAERDALKAAVVAELVTGGMAVTPADKAASRDARVVAADAARVAATLNRDKLSAGAERLRFLVKLAIVELGGEID